MEFLTDLHWGAVLQIVVIDILLGGDNAVVIALACKGLPPEQRRRGVLWGTAGAILLRLVLISFAVTLLNIPVVKLAGGLLLLWIGVRLALPDDKHHDVKPASRLLAAIKTIIVADLVMSLDNVIAIAGAAEAADPAHRIGLVAFGLVLSIPIIVFGSQLILRLLDRMPWIVIAGAALLGWIGGGLIVTDPLVERTAFATVPYGVTAAHVAGAVFVVVCAMFMRRRHAQRIAVSGERPDRHTD
ncbi:TerC family protein [Chitinasiproducens palmae]|uniref:Integral membrane protein, YjbE family n=1 Tax=Chitinasiproducens palmae TaxID=1770053 RepID=A0A1H2PY09_9BURK|nr:TerC family protein [Chitinasiproducens palmae]SDV51575.1 integral membrane protein, YjbE family [Chitinasiproducens palmae]